MDLFFLSPSHECQTATIEKVSGQQPTGCQSIREQHQRPVPEKRNSARDIESEVYQKVMLPVQDLDTVHNRISISR